MSSLAKYKPSLGSSDLMVLGLARDEAADFLYNKEDLRLLPK